MMARKSKKRLTTNASKHAPRVPNGSGRPVRLLCVAAALVAACIGIGWLAFRQEALHVTDSNRLGATAADATQTKIEAERRPLRIFESGNLTMFWDEIPREVLQRVQPTSLTSNIAPPDYAGPSACVECHKENHAAWSKHPHRWMNALANAESVRGDFSGSASIDYRGGIGKFFRAGDEYRMSFDRDGVHREYSISQTIGSRFYQYYVGRGIVGPEPQDHEYYREDFVLPFGYWLERKTWVPIVHVAEELPEGERWESSEQLKPPESQHHGLEGIGLSRGDFDDAFDVALIYTRSCNSCHTTFPLGEMFVRNPKLIGPYLPKPSLFAFSDYLAATRPEIWDGSAPPEQLASAALDQITTDYMGFDARDKGVSLGISCESCHLGCEAHAKDETLKPAFAPHSPHLLTYDNPQQMAVGRTPENVNAACARCHVGNRPTYAAGMATWNSTEYTDALRGGCYSQLTCVHCHNPHQATGPKWPKTPEQDDASCLACHAELGEPKVRQLHTHHRPGSSGDRCMNCHMPKINEGMQDVVRTHTIFSPTHPAMIESNQPNACNLCHLDRGIEWTINYLARWYGRVYSSSQIDANYSSRTRPVGLGWLEQKHAATRLVAAEALGEQKSKWALPALIQGLDDPYLLNRQFFQKSVEQLSGKQLDAAYGYWFYMTPDERRGRISRILRDLSPP